MAKLDWEREQHDHPIWGRDFRKKSDYERAPKTIHAVVPRKRKGPKRPLVPCPHPGCNNHLNPNNVTRHMRTQHDTILPPVPSVGRQRIRYRDEIGPKPTPDDAAVSVVTRLMLVNELGTTLPDVVLTLVKEAGYPIANLNESVPPQIAATIRAFFRRLKN